MDRERIELLQSDINKIYNVWWYVSNFRGRRCCIFLLPAAPKCQSNSAYSRCAPACADSCADPFASRRPGCRKMKCVEGCVCKAGYVLSGRKCVPRNKCGCTEAGRYFKVPVDIFLILTATRVYTETRFLSEKTENFHERPHLLAQITRTQLFKTMRGSVSSM